MRRIACLPLARQPAGVYHSSSSFKPLPQPDRFCHLRQVGARRQRYRSETSKHGHAAPQVSSEQDEVEFGKETEIRLRQDTTQRYGECDAFSVETAAGSRLHPIVGLQRLWPDYDNYICAPRIILRIRMEPPRWVIFYSRSIAAQIQAWWAGSLKNRNEASSLWESKNELLA